METLDLFFLRALSALEDCKVTLLLLLLMMETADDDKGEDISSNFQSSKEINKLETLVITLPCERAIWETISLEIFAAWGSSEFITNNSSSFD